MKLPASYTAAAVAVCLRWLTSPAATPACRVQPEVQAFIQLVDRTGGIYTHRWGDLLFHTAAVQIFLNESQVHKFTDWT